ncbi:hypothetical protein QYS48_32570 [Marivirga arenosa]|uniref:Uncharacterized protein n=1 Tax=Marivirga arenosa TaxID=3059076 RepID=A0AA51R697_9BACT|nr:hypothetical protein [Marivirga sp. ABR2-2]WMN06442.1 hypothetical protein QYS48_32570 [Marivirga sp. ABR2-2]
MKKLNLIFSLLLLLANLSNAQIEDPKIENNKEVSRSRIKVYTKTGEEIVGYFLSQNKDFLTIETLEGNTKRVPTQRIKKVESLGEDSGDFGLSEKSYSNLNSMRYMIGTSAFNYEKGVNYIRNNPFTFHRGLTENFSIGVGTSFFTMVIGAPLIYLNPKYTVQLGEYVHYKIGVDAFAVTLVDSFDGAAGAFVNTGFTVGIPDLNVTGTAYFGTISDVERINPFYSLSAMARISKRLMVLSEGFYVTTEFNDRYTFLLYGGRLLTDFGSYDLGLIYNTEIARFVPIGIPFFAATIKLN